LQNLAERTNGTMTDSSSRREVERLAALHSYEILDTPPDGAFDRITALAARHFKVPVALVSLVDEDRIWFKSRQGLEAEEIPRSPGLCASVIFSDDAYVVRNAIEDPRTLANPLVAGEMGVRFYAAVPLVTHDGYRLGTMNIIDFVPRELDAAGLSDLHEFAGLVMDQIELRLSARKTIAALSQVFQRAEPSADFERLVTVCAWSRKIKVDGRWVTFEEFLVNNLGVRITHGIAPEAARELHGQTHLHPTPKG
jgi:GAF domain-containing protein